MVYAEYCIDLDVISKIILSKINQVKNIRVIIISHIINITVHIIIIII